MGKIGSNNYKGGKVTLLVKYQWILFGGNSTSATNTFLYFGLHFAIYPLDSIYESLLCVIHGHFILIVCKDTYYSNLQIALHFVLPIRDLTVLCL